MSADPRMQHPRDTPLDYARDAGVRKPRFLPPWLDRTIGIALLVFATIFALSFVEGGL